MNYYLRPITDLSGCLHFQALERIVWGSDETEVVPNHVLVTVVQNGGGLIGAYVNDGPDGEASKTGGMVGAVFWWLGTTDERKLDARLAGGRADLPDARLSSRRTRRSARRASFEQTRQSKSL